MWSSEKGTPHNSRRCVGPVHHRIIYHKNNDVTLKHSSLLHGHLGPICFLVWFNRMRLDHPRFTISKRLCYWLNVTTAISSGIKGLTSYEAAFWITQTTNSLADLRYFIFLNLSEYNKKDRRPKPKIVNAICTTINLNCLKSSGYTCLIHQHSFPDFTL